MKPKYYFEIDCSDRECDSFGQWANYGTLVAEGNDLDSLIADASIDVMDQDGGSLDVHRADSAWMQDLIVEKYWEQNGQTRNVAALETFGDFEARMAQLPCPDPGDYDPTPWCAQCGAMERARCKCGPRADND